MEFTTGGEALDLFVALPIDGYVLDIGSGDGAHAAHMRKSGLDVVTLDSHKAADINDAWPASVEETAGGIWCCHTLEHSRNPGAFLDACRLALKPGGWLAITVPPAKHNIVGGHVTLWNAGLLLYHLVLAGFDCRSAMVKAYDYNISVILRRQDTELPALACDNGDIERLSHLFPFSAGQGFDGDIDSYRWGTYGNG